MTAPAKEPMPSGPSSPIAGSVLPIKRAERERWLASGGLPALGGGREAIEPRDQPPPPNSVTLRPGMTMAEIERAAIESALKETRGNRRRAAEMLGIGERTLYRKLREYQLPETLGMIPD